MEICNMGMYSKKTIKQLYGKEIPGYPGYRITKDGRVFRNTFGDNWKELKVKIKRVGISKRFGDRFRPKVIINKKLKTVYRLLAITYIPNPDNKPLVCHRDNNPLNSNLDNLYWGTYSENIKQSYDDNRQIKRFGEKNPVSKLTQEQADEIFLSSLSNRALAKIYGVSHSAIGRIKRGEAYVKV